MIFADLYNGQAAPHEIIHWMAQQGYQLAGIFDEHYSAEGWIAWCDACFVPKCRVCSYSEPFQMRTLDSGISSSDQESIARLEHENASLKAQKAKLKTKAESLRAEVDKLKKNPLRRLFRRLG